MINFVVSGLEDSLISEGQTKVPEDILNLISELNSKNIKFAVATGRNYDAVKPMFGKVRNDIFYICNDGGVIIYQDKIISKTPIDRLVCLDVTNEMEKDQRYRLIYSGERNAMITNHDIDFNNYLKSMNVEGEYIKDIKSFHGDITKITICAKHGLDEETYEHFYTRWSKNASVAISNAEQAFITAKYVTKGNALALLQHVYDISPEDTVVFGGGYSDIDMFEHSYYSYAMQYADAEVRRAAKHIAENVETILEDIIRI